MNLKSLGLTNALLHIQQLALLRLEVAFGISKPPATKTLQAQVHRSHPKPVFQTPTLVKG